MAGLHSRMNMDRDTERGGPVTERDVFRVESVVVVGDLVVPSVAILIAHPFEDGTVDEDARTPGPVATGQRVDRVAGTARHLLLTVDFGPIENRGPRGGAVTTEAVRADMLVRETQPADDRPVVFVSDREEPLERVRLEPHVVIEPEQPFGVFLEEHCDDLVAAVDDAERFATHRDVAGAEVFALVVANHADQRLEKAVRRLIRVQIRHRHRVRHRHTHGVASRRS